MPVDSEQVEKSMIISSVANENYKPIMFKNFDKEIEKTRLDSERGGGGGDSTPKRISYKEVSNPAIVVQSKLRGDQIDQYSTEISQYKTEIENKMA